MCDLNFFQSQIVHLLSNIFSLKTDISFKRINSLAIPALIAGIAEPFLSITDTAIVGNIEKNGIESLAAVGIVGAFISMLIWVFGQIRSAISSLISQYLGANKLEEIKTLPAQAIAMVVCGGIIVLMITYPFSKQIFGFYNASGDILDYCIEYYKIRIFGFPFSLFVFAVFGLFRGLQNTFYPMIIALCGASLNIGLDLAFVYGIDGLIPAMNIKGAAYASVISQIFMALLSIFFLRRKTSFSLKITRPFNKEIPTLLSMVINLFVRTIALNLALYFATSHATNYGKEYIAAYTIGINLWLLGAFIIDGYSSAGNVLAGKLLGSKDYRGMLQLGKRLITYGLCTGLVLTVVGFLFYEPIGTVFIKDELVQQEFQNVFWIILIMQPLCAITFIFDAMFKGMGEMGFLRNILLFSTLVVFIPSLYVFDVFDCKLKGVWFTFLLWIIARGTPLIVKFRRKFLPLVEKG